MAGSRASTVLEYWFGRYEPAAAYFERRNALWFGGDAATDSAIRKNFEQDVVRAAEGRLSEWERTPQGALALIVLLDQFSLNLYREKPRSYQQSELAIPVSEKLIADKLDGGLTPAERVFVYLPLEHSERLEDQVRSVALFERLAREAAPELRETMNGYLDYAVRHHRVVARYGRFPDRNEVFGRSSTPEELKFLASSDAPF